MWVVVKPIQLGKCSIQKAEVWHSFVGSPKWNVNYWGQIEREDHYHYRMPQGLIYDLDNSQALELIGVHLKSKINRAAITRDANGNLTGAYLETALNARVKLATEARNIREYITNLSSCPYRGSCCWVMPMMALAMIILSSDICYNRT